MIYVISDLHGYPLDRLKKLLNKAHFGEDDFLYILGDVIDRNGDGGVGILLWLLEQPNAQLILGNHEAMLLGCEFVFDEITEESADAISAFELEMLQNYTYDGGDVTLDALYHLPRETQRDILEYLHEAPLYEAVTAGGQDYILVHAGLGNFSEYKKMSEYTAADLLWEWPEITDEYYDDIHTVFGHTPTGNFDAAYDGKILRTRTWTCIDCGAGWGNEPVLLRLDDGAEFRNE